MGWIMLLQGLVNIIVTYDTLPTKPCQNSQTPKKIKQNPVNIAATAGDKRLAKFI
jgi:hypothetical protein